MVKAADMTKILDALRAWAETFFSDTKLSHDWDHTLRVHALCRHIGEIEGADLEVLEAAAYLHDIGRPAQDEAKGALCHAEEGARMAGELLATYDIPVEKRDNILHCILAHRFRNDHVPETLEARTLYDADKLDAIGAVGIARAYLFAGEVGAMLHTDTDPEDALPYTKDDTGYREFVVKLSKVRDRMLTREGRRLAEGRHAFMEAYFDRFLKEHEGLL